MRLTFIASSNVSRGKHGTAAGLCLRRVTTGNAPCCSSSRPAPLSSPRNGSYNTPHVIYLYIQLETLQSSISERPRYMPKATAIHHLNACHSGKSRSRSAKQQILQRLPQIWYSAKHEHSSSIHSLIGTGKSKSRLRRYNFLRRSSSHIVCIL